MLCFVACNGNQPNEPTNEDGNPNDYVDLGLPSGTKWKKVNENAGKADSAVYFHYDNAINQYKSSVPTAQQWKELTEECNWTWVKNCQEVVVGKDTIMLSGYKVVGQNGDSIMLPAVGCCSCSGDICNLGSYGIYMSSTPDGSEGVTGMTFYYDTSSKEDTIYLGYYLYCDGLSVRRIMNK